ncbi:MAG: dephospho-CoA kinase [Candidatus Omnitrophica bacterium]|nr:dephospho-CoA kinase [Candidatus Omnitrophota bacterium]
MLVCGLTGNFSSGKTLALGILKDKGADVLSCDELVHSYYRDTNSEVFKKVAALFPDATDAFGISRVKLAGRVIANKTDRLKLESIVHPRVIADLKKWIKAARGKKGIAIAEVPLLFEKNLADLFDYTILVYVKRQQLISRIVKQKRFSKSQAEKMLSLFLPIRKKIREADFLIDNNSNLKIFRKNIDCVFNSLNKINI